MVVPSWQEPPAWAGPDDLVLAVDPGRAFGSGAHPTTRMCLAELERVVEPASAVADVGCGSGVLAVAAARLGAALVVAVDIDDEAVRATVENAVRNDVAGVVIASDIPAAELELGYRSSSVGRHGCIVLRCSLRTAPGRTDLLRQAMVDHLASRRARQPLSERTAGSVFLPAAGRPAGEIIDRLDLVGARRGRAVVSRKHANWIEAGEGCTAAEIEELIAHVQEQAWLRGGVRLEREVQRFPAESTIVDLSARVRASATRNCSAVSSNGTTRRPLPPSSSGTARWCGACAAAC